MTFEYKGENLYFDSFNLSKIADDFGTPCYVYSRNLIESNFKEYQAAFGEREHLICYAVKANSNLSILKNLKALGAGFDIVSDGELERVKCVENSCANIVYSGVGKTEAEIENAIKSGVGCINLESRDELKMILAIAKQLGIVLPVSVRVNPNVNPNTHPYISTGLKENKFGVPIEDARELYELVSNSEWLVPIGIACHIGSQITDSNPVIEAVQEVVHLAEELKRIGIPLKDIDVGGGLGIKYDNEGPPSIRQWVSDIKSCVPSSFRIKIEPGRSIVGSAGVLLTKIIAYKDNGKRNFAISDAAMNDLLRPALYNAYHQVLPCIKQKKRRGLSFDLVGPICETGDWLAKRQNFSVSQGDLLAIKDVGAYGFCMASNYNSRPRPPEVLIERDGTARLIRTRESVADMLVMETECLEG